MSPTSSASIPHVSRRWVLSGLSLAAVAAGLSACGSGSSTSTSSSSASASASTPSTATADGTAAAGSVAALAQAFHATLDADQQTTVLLDYSFSSAVLWSNLPQGLLGGGGLGGGPGGGAPDGDQSGSAPAGGDRPSGSMPSGGPGGGAPGGGSTGARVGLSIGELDDTQLAAFTAMLQAATGTGTGVGYDAIVQQLNADDYLADNGGGDDYGRANYYVAILGSPQDTGTWELQFGGHHLAVANTYTDGVLAGATPSFRGVEPNGPFEQGGRTNEPLAAKEAAFTAMLAGLPADALATAELSDVYSDLVLGPGNDWAFPETREGVQVGTLADDVQALVLAAIASYVDDVADSDARAILARYEAELADTHVAWSGTTALTERDDYVRVDGPSVWIEFSMQGGIVLSGNHPHSVWRDRTTDYGGTQS